MALNFSGRGYLVVWYVNVVHVYITGLVAGETITSTCSGQPTVTGTADGSGNFRLDLGVATISGSSVPQSIAYHWTVTGSSSGSDSLWITEYGTSSTNIPQARPVLQNANLFSTGTYQTGGAGFSMGVQINLIDYTNLALPNVEVKMVVTLSDNSTYTVTRYTDASGHADLPVSATALNGSISITGGGWGSALPDYADFIYGFSFGTLYFQGGALLTPQVISFPAIPDQSTLAPITLAATSTSGLPITYTILSGLGSISGSTLTPTAYGLFTIQASQAGNTTYQPALNVTQGANVGVTTTQTSPGPGLPPSPVITSTGAPISRGNINANQVRADNKHGAGALLQTSDGTGTAGNLASFGAGGVLVDSGIPSSSLIIGFILNSGATGTNVGPELLAPRAGKLAKCKVVTKTSDASIALVFTIKQNGTSVFTSSPSISAATTPGTVSTFTTLTTVPLPVVADDVFTIDITGGSASWAATVQLES